MRPPPLICDRGPSSQCGLLGDKSALETHQAYPSPTTCRVYFFSFFVIFFRYGDQHEPNATARQTEEKAGKFSGFGEWQAERASARFVLRNGRMAVCTLDRPREVSAATRTLTTPPARRATGAGLKRAGIERAGVVWRPGQHLPTQDQQAPPGPEGRSDRP